MRVNFRQGVVSHQAGGFLQISGAVISLTAVNRPVTVTIAEKGTNYIHSEDNTVSTAWIGPFTEPRYWLYWDFNQLTFARTFGHTTLEPVAQSIEPGGGNVPITGAILGDAGIGAFLVDQFYDLNVGRLFAIEDSSLNNGNYTVKSISYSSTTGKTTIFVNEAVVSNIADGAATLDIDSTGQPLAIDGRHWYDTANNVHYVFNGAVWSKVLRVFSALLFNTNTFISMSQNSSSGDFTGTQIGNNSSILSGRVLFDESSNPMRRDDGTFFTTEDQFFTNQTRVDALRLESNVTRAQSIDTSLSAFSVVAWVDDGKVTSANYDHIGDTVVGLLTESLSINEVGAIIVQGTVTNPLWNWTQGTTPTPVGSKLWVENGLLVTTDPHLVDPVTNPTSQVPIARVLDKDTIIFEQGLGGVGARGPEGAIAGLPPADTTDIGGVTLLTPSSDPLRAFVISDTDSRLTNARAPLAHTHQALDVTFQSGGGVDSNEVQSAIVELGTGKVSSDGDIMTGFLTLSSSPVNIGHAATKAYVDNLVNGLIWLDPIEGVNLISDNVVVEPTSPNSGDTYILPVIVTPIGSPPSSWGGASGDLLGWSGTVWENFGTIPDIYLAQGQTGDLRFGIAMRSATIPLGTFSGRQNQIVGYDNTGTITTYDIPVENNAVYVDGSASLFAFDQYAYNGTSWVKIAGATQGISADGITTIINGGVMSVIPAANGGQVDAKFLEGNNLATLDTRYASSLHAHASTDISFTPYTGDGTWGNASDNTTGNIVALTVGAAITELADKKAEKTPLYATSTDLPSAAAEEGMLATVQDDNTVYYAGTSGWAALSSATHEHNIPYDMAFYVHGILLALQKIGIFSITRSVFVPAGAGVSLAIAGKAASSLPTTLIITREQAPYTGAPITVGSILFNPGSTVGIITWSTATAFVAGDLLILSTDAAPSDLEQVSITFTGCSVANACTLPIPPTVTFTPASGFFGGELQNGDPITGSNGSVVITGQWDTITWTQPRFSNDGGNTFNDAPGTISYGDLIFSNSTIQFPTVSEVVPDGLQYEVTITVSGPGGVASDTQIIAFLGS